MTQPPPTSGGLAGAARGSAYNVVGALLTTASGFGTVWLVSNEFGRLGTGALFTAVGLFTILAGATKLGTESSMTWYVSTTNDTPKSAAIAGVVGEAMLNVALLSTAVGGALMAASQPLASLLVDEPELRADFQRMLIVLGVALPLWATAQASYGVSRGYGTMRISVVAGSIVRPAVLLGTLAVLTLTTDSLWAMALRGQLQGYAPWLSRCSGSLKSSACTSGPTAPNPAASGTTRVQGLAPTFSMRCSNAPSSCC